MLLSLLLLACTPDAAPPVVDTGPQPDLSTPLRFDGPPPKNVLMISIDTFRKDHLDLYGDLGASPFLSRLAREGVHLADHAQCSNWTWHATSCTLNGRYEVDIGHVPNLVGERENLPDGIRTLARVLSEDHQYGTVLQSKNAWLGPKWNNAQGYDIVNPTTSPGGYNLVWSAVNNREAAMMRRGGDHWFVHAHLLEPHAPYVPPEELREGVDELPPLPEGIDLDQQDAHYVAVDQLDNLSEEDADTVLQHMRLRYQGEIRWTDYQLQLAFDELDAAGILDDTLVVVWTDHGEAFMEHGVQTHANHLYGEENDGILIFWAKNLQPFAYTGPTHAVDLVPTVLSILELPLDDDLAGYPLGTAPVDRIRYASVVARQGLQIAAMKDDHKLLYKNRGASYSLYDRATDPQEKLDLLAARPDHPLYLEMEPSVQERIDLFDAYFESHPGIFFP